MVIWIIGLSGSGKTYLSNEIFKRCSGKKILVDGDTVRKYITYELKYTKQDRKRNSLLISNLCNFLESQGFIVICSILSIFREHQRLNRIKYDNYFQIYINSEISKLEKRNNKNIYSHAEVVGKKIDFPTPYKNDIIVKNNFLPYTQKKINQIMKRIDNVKTNKKKYKKLQKS
jgi:adenylylsulfate kinase-like enzyme